MRCLIGCLLLLISTGNTVAAQQRVVAECTVSYKIGYEESPVSKEVQSSVQSSQKTVYIKGNDSRVDLISPSLTQSVIYDKANATAVLLREFGNNKFMSNLDKTKWISYNKAFEGLTVELVNESKLILGYDCKKAILKTKDGSVYTVFYATGIIPSVREFEYQFKDIPGFVLEYSIKAQDESLVNFKAVKISLSPVKASLFDIPTSGYRLLD